jgi:hypothetical protein
VLPSADHPGVLAAGFSSAKPRILRNKLLALFTKKPLAFLRPQAAHQGACMKQVAVLAIAM